MTSTPPRAPDELSASTTSADGGPRFRTLDEFSLADLEAVRLLLRGGSVLDWHRLNFTHETEILEFLRAQELWVHEAADLARIESVKGEAIAYLRRNFEFPVPKPVAQASLPELVRMASGRGHRQLCACTILKVMHIIHHLEGRELLFTLPVSDQEVFRLVEEKIYRVVGGMLASGQPVLEFIGGRKNKDSLYTKLMSKQETIAAQIYDKLRFRIVTRHRDDVWPVLSYLMRTVFPFNYAIPGQATNTIFHFRSYCEGIPPLRALLTGLQVDLAHEDSLTTIENRFTAPSYQVIHFVVDVPIRVPREIIEHAPPSAWSLGQVIFVLAEFQLVDRSAEAANELGEASHSAYKARQKAAVARRLKLGGDPRQQPTSAASATERRQRLPTPPPPPGRRRS